MVNNGSFHLLLDGQQRLATTTILLAVLRDKINEYSDKAARQIQDLYITFENYLTGEKIFKIQLNVFDRDFFRDRIQSFPRVESTPPTKKSHQLIDNAYAYFKARVDEGWVSAGDGKKGFEWAGNTSVALCDHLALVTVISNNEKTAGSIFTTLNDRGIGLSTVDLIRSSVLQLAHETQREEIIVYWNSTLEASGTAIGAETLIRISWVSQHGDIKARALYKDVSEHLETEGVPLSYSRRLRDDAVQYKKFREGDTDDDLLQGYWTALRTLNANAGYALLLGAYHHFNQDDQKSLAKAIVSLAIRHNIVCDIDRAKFESAVFTAAKRVSGGEALDKVLEGLRSISPHDDRFREDFARLKFSAQQHTIARFMLQSFEDKLALTKETTVAGSAKVHVEHIYPQNPPQERKWENHGEFVNRLGNLTLLDRGLNIGIKNADFAAKKDQAYCISRLEITKQLLEYPDEWSPDTIIRRQNQLSDEAASIWPEALT